MPVIPDDIKDVELVSDDFGTSDSELSDGVPAGAFGDIHLVPPEALEQIAAPLDFSSPEESDASEDVDGIGEPWGASLVTGAPVHTFPPPVRHAAM
jgi:hypothetical protein